MEAPEESTLNSRLDHITHLLQQQADEIAYLRSKLDLAHHSFSIGQLTMLNPSQRRNFLPNDSAALQKLCMMGWASSASPPIDHKQLIESGFRVFSQGDEDGILLRIFQKVGATNKVVIEIGSNCDSSDLKIPENLSTNLIVNHGWHGLIIEMDAVQCDHIRYFFAQHPATKHFHAESAPGGFFSPIISNSEVTPDNIDSIMQQNLAVTDPDLLIIDIDGGDFAVIERMTSIKPRVLVIEFEKRFRHQHSVIQKSRHDFSRLFPQSGTASLAAWNKLLSHLGYVLCSISGTGFNAFFVRADVANGFIEEASVESVFNDHPVFASASMLWREPDDGWSQY
jgi:hypothetical protein